VILSFVIGVITGAGVVSSSVNRTIAVAEGNANVALSSSILNSITYGASIYFIAKSDWIGYAGSMLGSTIVCVYMAKNKDKSNRGIANGNKEGTTT